MLWVLLPAAVWATDIWQAEMADGSLLFTDSPTVAGFRPVLLARKPMPARNRVSVGRFPRLDAYDSLIVRIAAEEGVSPTLLKAVALAESGMNPAALSPKGAMGLTQLMPGTARALGVDDPWDPAANLRGGARYLRRMLDTFGTARLALAAYNAGPGNVKKHGGVPPFDETQEYVVKVLDLHDLFTTERPLLPAATP